MPNIEKTFGEYIFKTLKEDEELGKYVENLVLPSDAAKTKATASSVAGGVLGAVIGVGWKAQTGVAIAFKNCPIYGVGVFESGHIRLHLQTNYPKGTIKTLWIEAKTKGLIHKEVVGVGLRFEDHTPLRHRIEKDQKLINDLLQLFKSGKFENISEYTQARINIKIEGNHGQIEGKMFTDVPEDIIRAFFRCLLRIASYVQLGSAIGVRKCIVWNGTSNKRMKTTNLRIPDSSDAPWDIDRTWRISWRPHETKQWKDEWCNTAHCRIEIYDAETDKLLKQTTLKCQQPHNGFGVDELESPSEPLKIWGRIYLVIEAAGYEGQWQLEIRFFEGSGITDYRPEEEHFLDVTEQGNFETDDE